MSSFSLQKLPSVSASRVETGPVQFGEDWPGVFIRGDTALMGYLPSLDALLSEAMLKEVDPIGWLMLTELRDLLASCSTLSIPPSLSAG